MHTRLQGIGGYLRFLSIGGCLRFLPLKLELVFEMIYFRLVRWLFPNKRPQSPCKRFTKKNSLACYRLIFNRKRYVFDHYELIRIINPKAGEYYLFPIEVLQKKANWHISYHRSGTFHWRDMNGESAIPRDGEADARRPFLMNQAMWHISGRLDGYCLAVGPKVSEETLGKMIEIMDGYILPPLKLIANIQTLLLDRKNLMIPMLVTPHSIIASKVVAEARDKGEASVLSRAEVEARCREAFGDQCKIVLLEPKTENYAVFSAEVMEKLIDIARSLCLEKMEERPSAFWTDPPSTCSKQTSS